MTCIALRSFLIKADTVSPEASLRRVHNDVVVSPGNCLSTQKGKCACLVRTGVDLISAYAIISFYRLGVSNQRGVASRSGRIRGYGRHVTDLASALVTGEDGFCEKQFILCEIAAGRRSSSCRWYPGSKEWSGRRICFISSLVLQFLVWRCFISYQRWKNRA